jgi:hypothetical protein
MKTEIVECGSWIVEEASVSTIHNPQSTIQS